MDELSDIIDLLLKYLNNMVFYFRLLTADFASAAVLISFGVVLGKASPFQLIIMALIEIVLFVANEVLGRAVFGVRHSVTDIN